jgi:hypothetical protein
MATVNNPIESSMGRLGVVTVIIRIEVGLRNCLRVTILVFV